MEEIKVYNTLTGEKTVFRPLVPGGSQDLCLRRHTVQSPPYRECPSGGDLGCDLPLSEAYRL